MERAISCFIFEHVAYGLSAFNTLMAKWLTNRHEIGCKVPFSKTNLSIAMCKNLLLNQSYFSYTVI